MWKIIFKLLFIFLILIFLRAEALAIPYEYSITGTAFYRGPDGDMVFRDRPITGGFVLNDPVMEFTYDPLIQHFETALSDMIISGEGFALSGTGNLHVTFYGLYRDGSSVYPNLWGPEHGYRLDLEGYNFYADGHIANLEWFEPYFRNEDGSIDRYPHCSLIDDDSISISFDAPYRMVFSASVASGTDPQPTGDFYSLQVTAVRGQAVPEPATLLLLGSGLLGLLGLRRKLKR